MALKFGMKVGHTSPCILHTIWSVIPPHGQWAAPMDSWQVMILLSTPSFVLKYGPGFFLQPI